jgi:hypothetical protein
VIDQMEKEIDELGGQIDYVLPAQHTVATAIEDEGTEP